ncbi:MAG: hypothetical protein M2R45_02904 [Verrucomicrobia subdivision 3 bacterium]|nr:hypothetical protein [Limisphaerales bacterium]MCS1414756.1 hypothetical protein [Limisphaerales bacterium]
MGRGGFRSVLDLGRFSVQINCHNKKSCQTRQVDLHSRKCVRFPHERLVLFVADYCFDNTLNTQLQQELNMKFNQWTLALASAGMVSLSSITQADDPTHSVLSHVSKTTLSGYVDTSAIWALGEGGNGNTLGRTNDGTGRLDGFNLNVVQLSLEKPLDESEWAAGYTVDLWFGPDAQWLGSDTFRTNDDLGIKQAYVTMRAPIGNGLDIKMGQFDTIIGYEASSSPLNPNFSRSYGFFLEPFQHTGALASYQLTDAISISGGVANTYGFGVNDRVDEQGSGNGSESQKTYMASISYDIPEEAGFLSGGALYFGFVDGLVAGSNDFDKTSYYVGATIPTPMDGLAVGVAFDYAQDTSLTQLGVSLPGGIGAVPLNAWALAGYLSYQATEKMTFNGRVDYATVQFPVFEDPEFLSVTGTVNYDLWENVLTRLEVRWDHSLEGGVAGIYDALLGDEGEDDLVTIALNAVYQF